MLLRRTEAEGGGRRRDQGRHAHTAGPGATRLLDGKLEAVSIQRTITRFIYGELSS